MNEELRHAFERALIRAIGEDDPLDAANKILVSKLARKEIREVNVDLKDEKKRWKLEMEEMRTATPPIKDTDPVWVDAKEFHDNVVAGHRKEIARLQNIGS